MTRMGTSKQRFLGLCVGAAVLAAGAITATQALAATSAPPAQRIGDFFMCADNHTRALQLAWSSTACPTGSLKFVVPTSQAGGKGATGATGPTGATGAIGPSDLYAGTQAVHMEVGDVTSTFATVAVPAGSYQVQFSLTVDVSSATQTIICAVYPSSGPSQALPYTAAAVTSAFVPVPMSASGWYTTATGTTFALTCAATQPGGTALLNRLQMTALKVGAVH
jgi:hypothetical protein